MKEIDFKKILTKESSKNNMDDFEEITSFLLKEKRISNELKKQISNCGVEQSIIKCAPENNHDVLVSMIKCAFENKKKVLVILTSLNYKTLIGLIEKSKIPRENVFMIDTISKNILKNPVEKNVSFIGSLRDLTKIQIKLINQIESEKKFVVLFDSMDTLSLYHKEKIIFKFFYSLTKILRKNNISGYFIASVEENIPKLSQFFDNLIELEKID